jgi:hypothetical protein
MSTHAAFFIIWGYIASNQQIGLVGAEKLFLTLGGTTQDVTASGPRPS